jgi:recombination protein RecA
MYGKGISREGDLLDLAVELGVVEKSGTWYSFGEERIGQGRENVKRFMIQDENKDVREKMENAVKGKLGLNAGDKKEDASAAKEA